MKMDGRKERLGMGAGKEVSSMGDGTASTLFKFGLEAYR
jgi:hypothetical protein